MNIYKIDIFGKEYSLVFILNIIIVLVIAFFLVIFGV